MNFRDFSIGDTNLDYEGEKYSAIVDGDAIKKWVGDAASAKYAAFDYRYPPSRQF